MTNSTIVTEFILMGFAERWEIRFLLFMLFLLMYLATLVGNSLIIIVTTFDERLHTPMYFFLRNMSALDVCFISITVPNACVNSLTGNKAISLAGCASQIFLVVYCAYVEFLFLTIMARDRYVAICQPLHYPVIMTHRFCVWTTLASLISGLSYAAMHTGITFHLSFCQSNVVHQFFCDIPSLLILSCSDISLNKLIILGSCIFVGGCFIYIFISYAWILSTVLKFSRREQAKAFSTCFPHIFVVSVYLTSIFCVYLRSSDTSETILDMTLSVFYAIVPPFLNPIIYSLRNKLVKDGVRETLQKLYFGK